MGCFSRFIGSRRRDRNVKTDVKKNIYVVSFSANGKDLVSGEVGGVGLWRVEYNHAVKTMTIETKSAVICLAVSADGRRIAAGTEGGDVLVLDAQTNEKVFSHIGDNCNSIFGVDFTPDFNRLLTASGNGTATVWDIATRQRVLQLPQNGRVKVANYSPQGDRIVVATDDHVRVYDTDKHTLLVDINVTVTASVNTGFLWFSDHLFVISDDKIKQFAASSGSIVTEWPAPGSNEFSCIAMPKHGRFIAYSSRRTVTLWDTSTRTELGLVQHPQDIHSIAISPDDQYLAIGGKEGMITFESLSNIDSTQIEPRHITGDIPGQRTSISRTDGPLQGFPMSDLPRPSSKKPVGSGETARRPSRYETTMTAALPPDVPVKRVEVSLTTMPWK